jgi:pimeloyl-ACP methyl ester carboxylesterase
MANLQAKRFESPDEVRPFKDDKGNVELVELSGHMVGHGTFEPGWRWSEHVKPLSSRSGQPSFVLVHGAWHDARVWDPLRAILGRNGHRTVAVDLPSDDVDVDASGYADVIGNAVRDLAPDQPIVVGHSMSGIALPLVPALAPVRRLVFLAALIPTPGQKMADIQAREHALGDTRAIARDEHGRSYWTSIDAAIDILYHDCDQPQARETAIRLRPQARTPHEQACPLARFPEVPMSYILMHEDRMIRPEWSRTACPARLGVEPIELPGGHSPMLAQPERLAQRLIELAVR